MRKIAALLSLVIVLLAGMELAHAGDAATIDAVNVVAAALDTAFESQKAEDIERLTTPEHFAVTPYCAAPRSVEEHIASLPDLKYEQTVIGEVKVTRRAASGVPGTTVPPDEDTISSAPERTPWLDNPGRTIAISPASSGCASCGGTRIGVLDR